MGDAEDFQPSKKRASEVQLSRDNPGLDDEEEVPQGTFKKASEEVLARRKIVKVRRQQTSTPAAPPPSASNPFAAIRLVPPTSSAQSKETEQIDESKPENKVDGPSKDDSITKEGKADVNDDNTKQSEKEVDDSKAQPKDETDNVVNQDKEKPGLEEVSESTEADTRETQTGKDVKGGEDGKEKEDEETAKKNADSGSCGDVAKKSTESDTLETQTGKAVKDDEDEKEKGNEETAEKNAEATPFGSFKTLSSNQNAFSGLGGTGFSTTSFSFGSITKDGSAPKSDGSTFSFGGSNNGSSSIFGSFEPTTITKSEGSKFPPMQEVPLETGEEGENAVFTADSILFEYIDGAWKERGKGELKINVSTTGTGKARLVMRSRGNYRLILNASLFPDMKLTNMDKKGITFACVNSAAEGKDGLSTIALKFKDPSILEDFRAAVTNHKSTAPAALRTPENSPKADE